jgi:hypothetical protein
MKMRRPQLVVLLATAVGQLVILGCNNHSPTTVRPPSVPPASATAAPGQGFFADVTAQTGIEFTYRNGQEAGNLAILESLGGGVILIDYDRDGLLDIFLAGGGHYVGKEIRGHPCKLYKNLGNWKFRDVTIDVGLDQIDFYTHGGTVGDFDNDGWPDLVVTGWGRTALFHNNHGKFEDVTQKAGLLPKDVTVNVNGRPVTQKWHWSTSAGFADFNGDGLPDLYVCHYVNWHLIENNPTCKDYTGKDRDDVCSPKKFDELPHYLYLNNGDGTFRDFSKEAGLKPGKGLGLVVADFNHDGMPDVYIANDTRDNYLYLNQGGAKFQEVGIELAVAKDEDGVPNGSMGVDTSDYDGSGHFSIFVTNYQQEAHALYRNRGLKNGRTLDVFNYASGYAGIKAIGLNYVGFGTSFLDFDLDGAEDLIITNGHVIRHPPPPGTLQQKPVLLRNPYRRGMKPFEVRFDEVSREAGPFFQIPHMGRGLVIGDLDNDGKPDIVFSNLNEPVVVLRNVLGNGHHWLGIELVGKRNRYAVGAELTLEVNGRKLVRQVKGGGSYLSASDRRIVFGLGTAMKVDRLTIRWPWGEAQTWEGADLQVDHYCRLVEGESKPQTFAASENIAPVTE